MKTREQKAADIYSNGRDCVMKGGNSLRSLARHIKTVVFGNEEMEGPLWRARQWPDQTITLERFEDYLLKPAREGLGIPSMLWLRRVLNAHPEKEEREDALKAVRQEVPNFDAKADAEERKELLSVDAAGDPHSRPGNQSAKKVDDNAEVNSLRDKQKPRWGSKDPERIVSRLKRDAKTDTRAAEMLTKIERGEVKPYRAAKEMGYVKPMRSIPIDTPEAAIRALLRVFTVTDLAQALGRVADAQAES